MSGRGCIPVIAIHGGAGVPDPERLDAQQRGAVLAGMALSLKTGREVLVAGGSALDACQAAVCVLEDDPAFNAGVGAALTSEGHAEHDAAIMCGHTRRAGAVSGSRQARHPVQLARHLLEGGPHVFLAGAAPDRLARELGLELLPPEAFVTPRRLAALQAARQVGTTALSEDARHGTVGAVALDSRGHLAAATSTGGLTNKLPGRVGDSPLIGAGTYALDGVCAISATGRGEAFIRSVFAHRVASLVELACLPLKEASARALKEVAELGGAGGLAALAGDGSVCFSFNSRGLYRGAWALNQDAPYLDIY